MNICFSFDDGRSDAYLASNILRKYELPGTFHIVTGFIDGTYISDDFGIGRKPVAVVELTKMKIDGMEISSHGDKHCFNDEDFLDSVRKLKEWNLIDTKVGLSIPFSKYTNEQLGYFVKNNKNIVDYIRIGRADGCYMFISKVWYALYHITKNQLFYNLFNRYNLIKNVDRYHIHSLVVKKDCHSKNVIKFIKKYAQQNVSLVLMFHSIVDNPKDVWEYSINEFKEICETIKELKDKGIVEVKPLREMVNE